MHALGSKVMKSGDVLILTSPSARATVPLTGFARDDRTPSVPMITVQGEEMYLDAIKLKKRRISSFLGGCRWFHSCRWQAK